MKPQHRYFIHFTFQNKNGNSSGSCNAMWELDTTITTIDDINRIQSEIEAQFIRQGNRIERGTLVISNYIYVGRIS